MIRKKILIVIFIISSHVAISQPFIGLVGQFGSFIGNDASDIGSLAGGSINAGFKLIKRINLGAEYSYNKRLPNIIEQNFTSTGVLCDYFLLNKDIKPIIGFKLAYATSQVKDNIPNSTFPKYNGLLISPRLGVSFQSNKHIHVNIFGSYDVYLLDENYSFFTGNAGVSYSF